MLEEEEEEEEDCTIVGNAIRTVSCQNSIGGGRLASLCNASKFEAAVSLRSWRANECFLSDGCATALVCARGKTYAYVWYSVMLITTLLCIVQVLM